MASSNLGKRCYRCDTYKKHDDFVRPSGNSTNECSTFNICAEIKEEKDLRLLDIAWFSLTNIENLIANCFENEEPDCICFRLNLFLCYIEAGSRYYLEIRKIYSHKKNNQLTGKVIVYMGCAQREERKRTLRKSADKPINRPRTSYIP
ncbi:11229_t:CDS:2 [Gigaspora rosea]|nr:11229_t:CDS:2 [Gigaspora rosea]